MDETLELCPADATPVAASEAVLPTVAEWTEAQMRTLLGESLERASSENGAARRFRINKFAERLHADVSVGDSADMIRVMCDLTNSELREVVTLVVKVLQSQGLKSVAFRVDDFDRIVLFDEARNKGFAIAPSGSYQRVSKFYDGSYRYGIELLLDQSLKTFIDAIFREIKLQIV
ncbi:MAG: hypothetical protein SGJ27_12930 [Candidatus Melainabacteria bacterium]|nr:hypothetical protein [Candidatus Melainabacteria bacterium]